MIYLAIVLSVGINIFLGWFVYNLLKDRIMIIEHFNKFSPLIKSYEQHLNSLTKMELYFGEPTLMSLVEHTKEVRETLDNLLESIEVEKSEQNETTE